MRLVWVVIPLVLIGIVGTSESFVSHCSSGTIRLQDSEYSSQYLEIGKDTLRISGNLVNLSGKTQDVLLTFRGSDTGGYECSGPIFFFPNYTNEGLHFEKISGTSKNVFLESGDVQPFEMELKPLKSGTYYVRTVALTDTYVNLLDRGLTIIVTEMSPLKQIASQTLPENIICNKELELIFKSSDNSPACVTPSTATKLIMRGWIANEGNLEEEQTAIPFIFPPNSDFINLELSHYPKLNETATLTATSTNAYPFDLTLSDDQFLSIHISNGFEFVNVPEDQIQINSNHGYSISQPLLGKQNQTQSLTADIMSLVEGKHRIDVYGIGGIGDSLFLVIDEFESLPYSEDLHGHTSLEVTENEFLKIMEQRKKFRAELDRCHSILDEWDFTSTNYVEHHKLVLNFHACNDDVIDDDAYAGINLKDCYHFKQNNGTKQYTLQDALEIHRMRIDCARY